MQVVSFILVHCFTLNYPPLSLTPHISQEKRIGEVLEASTKFSKVTEEKIIQKMETTLKNREGQLQNLMTRLAEHVSSLAQHPWPSNRFDLFHVGQLGSGILHDMCMLVV